MFTGLFFRYLISLVTIVSLAAPSVTAEAWTIGQNRQHPL